MSISALSPASASSPADPAASGRVPKKTLGQEDFLKLITVQLAKQDPMKPMEDTAFMAQMAQFSALEQSSQMARDMAALRSDLAGQTSANLLDREVTFLTPGGEVTARVEAVDYSGSSPRLSAGGASYGLDQVVRVAPSAASQVSK